MNDLAIRHPELPPPWLAKWPGERDVRVLFKPAVRDLAAQLLLRPAYMELRWDEEKLVANVGGVTVSWQLGHDGLWKRRCSCPATHEFCPHSYAACWMLADVCRRQGWQRPGNAEPKAGPGRPSATPVPLQRPEHRPGGVGVGGDLFGSGVPQPLASNLVVEADFRHEPPLVTLRFYVVSDDVRALASLSSLRNHAAGAAGNLPGRRRWLEADRAFLVWLPQHLRRLGPGDLQLQVLKIQEAEFERWRERWQAVPGRFIERTSQQALPPPGQNMPVRQRIVLRDLGEWIEIAALFDFPGGRSCSAHELLASLSQGDNGSPELHDVFKYHPPVSWKTMQEFFLHRSPQMRSDKFCANIGRLLEGRLELVEGECVEKRIIRDLVASVRFDGDIGQFSLRCQVQGGDLPLQGEYPRPAEISRPVPGQIRIVLHELVPVAAQARAALLELAGSHPQAKQANGAVVLPASAEHAVRLKQFWDALPDGVQKSCAPALQPLLKGEGALRAALFGNTQGQVVDLQVTWNLDGHEVSRQLLNEAKQHGQACFRNTDGRWFSFPAAAFDRLCGELADKGFHVGEGNVMLGRQALAQVQGLPPECSVSYSRRCQELLARIQAAGPAKIPPVPASLTKVLRPYQAEGFRFLADRCLNGVGAILADDMGLGKTLQVLALLLAWKKQRAAVRQPLRALVITPASVMGVWRQQAEQFCPELRVGLLDGNRSQRAGQRERQDLDLLITHYALARQEGESLLEDSFTFLILDEAQVIKNPEAQITRLVKQIPAEHRLALTGTPLENHLLDLWSIMDFLNPGYLGEANDFLQQYGNGGNGLQALSRRLAPLMLRRAKALVAPELPPRMVQLLTVPMREGQRQLYERTLQQVRAGSAGSGTMEILAAITRLRQVCCDPELLLQAKHDLGSAKLELLLERLQELLDEGHSVLVFSQFTRMLEVMSRKLQELQLPFRMLTGATTLPERERLVREFSAEAHPSVFLLSLKAAGTGLTLTKADYVFLYDPWWNPAVENQAIDRTHRIGQSRSVMAYRLAAENSIEERVIALLESKRELFDAVVGGTESVEPAARLDRESLLELLR